MKNTSFYFNFCIKLFTLLLLMIVFIPNSFGQEVKSTPSSQVVRPKLKYFLLPDMPDQVDFKKNQIDQKWLSQQGTEVGSLDALQVKLGAVAWYKIVIDTSQLPPEEENHSWFFHMRAAHQSETTGYLFVNSELTVLQKGGYKTAEYNKGYFTADLVMPLEDLNAKSIEIFVKTNPTSKMPFWPSVKNQNEMAIDHSLDLAIIAGYVSIVIIMMMYQLFVFQTLKDVASLGYAMFCLTMTLSAVGRSGYADMLFGQKMHGFYFGDWMIFWVGLNTFTAVSFMRTFYNMHVTAPKMDKFSKYFLYSVLAIYSLAALAKPDLLNKIVPAINLFAGLLAIGFSIYGIKKKIVGSLYYLIAWGGFIGFISYYNMSLLGAIEMPGYMKYLTYFAGLWEAYLTAIGLSHRMKKYKDLEVEAELKATEITSLHRLVRILCHDVANPLTVISANIDMIKKRLERNELASIPDRLAKMTNAAKMITTIIDDVRAFEAVKSKKIAEQVQPVNLCDIVRNSAAIFEEKCIDKNIRINLPSVAESFYVYANANALQTSVISNIFSNAIKFTHPEKSIDVNIKTSDDSIYLSIRDHGIGIPQDLMKILFSPHKATSRTGTNDEKGTGFGMLLIKEFMESFGGKVEVSSKSIDDYPQDHGTTITLQFKKAQAVSAPSETSTESESKVAS